MSAAPRVVIVGAGPAGLAAADILRKFDVALTLVDEQPRAGGQILRQPPKTFVVERWLAKKLYARAKTVLHAVQDCAEVKWRMSTTVLGIVQRSAFRAPEPKQADLTIWTHGPAGGELLTADALLIAAGCYERPLAFPGWTLAGVMGAGGIQAFIKSQQFVPGKRFVLVGSHPLQLVVADQLIGAGADVAAVVFTQRRSAAARILNWPVTMLEHGGKLLEIGKIIRRLRRAGVTLLFGHSIVGAEGKDAVTGATLAALGADGRIDLARTTSIDCDRIGVCHGFLASSELARQAGARVRWAAEEGGWLVQHDEWFQTSVNGIFVGGEITGLAGADAALEKGRIAAAGILRAIGRIDAPAAKHLARAARRRLRRVSRFASALNTLACPPATLDEETLTHDSFLCRCEMISRGAFEQALRDNPHIVSADAAKLLTRVGMGMCQGRLCGANAARLIALLRNVTVSEVGAFQVQLPVKPVLLHALCAEIAS